MSVRVGVVGVGALGQHHARVYADLPGATLAGIYDADLSRAAEVAARHGVPAFRQLRELTDAADAISVAVPTVEHHRVARTLLEAGKDVLVGSGAVQVDAVGIPVLTSKVDIANVRLRFASGLIANLTASRVSAEKVRKFRVFSPKTYISVDFAARAAQVYRLVQGEGGPEITAERTAAPDEEPLR